MLLSSIAIVAASAALTGPAAASTGGTAAGAFTFVDHAVTWVEQAGGNRFGNEVATISYTGGLIGIANATDTIVLHADGSINGHGTETCGSCTIGGRTGSFTAVFTFHGSGGQVSGRETFISSTGGLAGLHGGGQFQGSPPSLTYSYDYGFASDPRS
jgi:hypothetical protein